MIKKFLFQACNCKEKALFNYCKGLDLTRTWPLEEWGSRKPTEEPLEGLKLSKYDPPEVACICCQYDIGSVVVQRTSLEVEDYFDGLCMQCMDSSRTSSKQMDTMYWSYDRSRAWGANCSVNHGQPTWYFSFMGRKAEMDAHKERERERKRARERRDSWF